VKLISQNDGYFNHQLNNKDVRESIRIERNDVEFWESKEALISQYYDYSNHRKNKNKGESVGADKNDVEFGESTVGKVEQQHGQDANLRIMTDVVMALLAGLHGTRMRNTVGGGSKE
jgi:hypothetical protein